MAAELESILARLAAVEARLDRIEGLGDDGDYSMAIDAFQNDILNVLLKEYMALSETLGGIVFEQAKMFQAGFLEMKNVIKVAAKSIKPSSSMDPEFQKLVKPFGDFIIKIEEMCGRKCPVEYLNFVKAVSGAATCFQWFLIEQNTPYPRVKEAADAAYFYLIKIMKEKKENEVAWCKSLHSLVTGLSEYIKEHHKTGMQWNSNGKPLAANSKAR